MDENRNTLPFQDLTTEQRRGYNVQMIDVEAFIARDSAQYARTMAMYRAGGKWGCYDLNDYDLGGGDA